MKKNPSLKSFKVKANLKNHTLNGAMWNVALALANKGVTFLGQWILVYLLAPSDIGQASAAQATTAFLAILSVGGLGDVLLQRNRYLQESGQALWLSLVFSSLTALAIAALAWLSPAFGRPVQRELLLVLASATFIGFPATVLAAGLKDRLDFKGLAFALFWGGCLYTVLAVFFARLGWGPFALLAPLVPQQLLNMGLMYRRDIPIKFAAPSWKKLRPLVHPTLSLAINGLFTALQYQAPVFICSLVLASQETGYFSWGWMAANQAVFLLAVNLKEILLPAFTKLNRDPEHAASVAMMTARAMTAFLCVACGIQAILAGPCIKILVPEKWAPATSVVICASLGFSFQGLWVSGMAWLNATGNYKKLLYHSALQALLTSSFTWIGVLASGFQGAAQGCAVATILGSLFCILPMGFSTLQKRIASWWKPLLLSAILWPLLYQASRGRGLAAAVAASVAFAVATGWSWWKEDDGGLKSIQEKISSLLKKIPLLSLNPS